MVDLAVLKNISNLFRTVDAVYKGYNEIADPVSQVGLALRVKLCRHGLPYEEKPEAIRGVPGEDDEATSEDPAAAPAQATSAESEADKAGEADAAQEVTTEIVGEKRKATTEAAEAGSAETGGDTQPPKKSQKTELSSVCAPLAHDDVSAELT